MSTIHLVHFTRTSWLGPALVAARRARVVTLSSRGHASSAVDLEDAHFIRRPYDKWIAYGQSKTANALFALALDARGAVSGVRAFSVPPGALLETGLSRSFSQAETGRA